MSPDNKDLYIIQVLEEHKSILPTFFKETKRIDTNIITLRNGLLEVIKEDHDL